MKLVWHYGYGPDAFSALLLKVPERNLTLILLANSDGLSTPFYDNWGVETSAFASCFLRLFVFEDGRRANPARPRVGRRGKRNSRGSWPTCASRRTIPTPVKSCRTRR